MNQISFKTVFKCKWLLFIILLGMVVVFWIERPTRSQHELKVTQIKINSFGEPLNRFNVDSGRYPTTEEGLEILYYGEVSYLRFPSFKDLWGNKIIYRSTPYSKEPFELYSIGENGIDESGEGDDINYWHTREEIGEMLGE